MKSLADNAGVQELSISQVAEPQMTEFDSSDVTSMESSARSEIFLTAVVFAFCFLAIFMLSACADGGGSSGTGIQSSEAAIISGKIIDNTGTPVSGVEVTHGDTGEKVVSDTAGDYAFTEPSPNAGFIIEFKKDTVESALVIDAAAATEPTPVTLNVVLDTDSGFFMVKDLDTSVSSDDEPTPGPQPEAPIGEACGVLTNKGCESGSYCKFDVLGCGTSNLVAHCTPIAQVCTEIYAPVCGCDNVTYSSECFAEGASQSLKAQGECR